MNSLKSKLFLFIALGFLIFVALSFYADVGNIVRSLQAFNWFYLPVILFLAFLNYLLRFFKWDYYRSYIDIQISRKQSFVVFMSGLAMSVTPGKLGEFLKAYLVKELNNTPISYSAPIVVAERFTDFIAIIMLSAYGIFFFQYGSHALIASTVLVLGFLFIVSYRPLVLKIIHYLHAIPYVCKISHRIETSYQSAQRLMAPKPLIFAILISIGAWFCECYAFYLVFKGLNLSVSLSYAIFVYAFATLIGAVSMLPGGLGATEGSMTGLLILFEIPKHTAVTATIIIRICTLWFAVFVGILSFIFGIKSFIKKSVLSRSKD